MASHEIQNMLDRTEKMLEEAESAAIRARGHITLLRDRVKHNRKVMERAKRQFGPSNLWGHMKP